MKTNLEFSRYLNCLVNMAKLGIRVTEDSDPSMLVDVDEYIELSNKCFRSKDPIKFATNLVKRN